MVLNGYIFKEINENLERLLSDSFPIVVYIAFLRLHFFISKHVELIRSGQNRLDLCNEIN
jgi:hypothetical protein